MSKSKKSAPTKLRSAVRCNFSKNERFILLPLNRYCQNLMAFPAKLDQRRHEYFDHKGLFVERIPLLVQKEDMQTITTAVSSSRLWLHRNSDLSSIAIGGNGD